MSVRASIVDDACRTLLFIVTPESRKHVGGGACKHPTRKIHIAGTDILPETFYPPMISTSASLSR
jgi:hypothetical protein